jgi:hypothetical protein
MRNAECQVLHVVSDSIESGKPGRPGQDTRSEGDAQVFEQGRGSTRAKIVADES